MHERNFGTMKPVSPIYGRLACFAMMAVIALTSQGFSQDPNFYIFLAFGQSNSEGWTGSGVNQIEQQDRNVPERFQTLPAVDWPNNSRKKGTWTTAEPPLCRSSTGLSPYDYFGRTLVDTLPENIRIGIINVSVAGCKIEMFDKDKDRAYINNEATWMKDIDAMYGNSPYGRLVEMGKLAQKDGVIKGFLLHQGESGSMGGNNWAAEVKKVYTDLIHDLNLDAKKVPLLAGGLTADGKSNQNTSLPWSLVKPTLTFENCHAVSSIGCAANMNDGFGGVHFSGPGYRKLGKNYADTMLTILRSQATGVASGRAQNRTALGSGVELKVVNSSIIFSTPQKALVTLKAYTLGGKEIDEFAHAEFAAGKHQVTFGKKMPAGVFVLMMHAGSRTTTRTIFGRGSTLLKS